MEETLDANIVLKRGSIEAAGGEVGDSTMCTEYEEGKIVGITPECDSFKKCKDIGKAVSFADDHEISEMSQSSVKAEAISSLHFMDCKPSVHTEQHKVQDNGLDPSEPGLTRIVDSDAGIEHPEVDQMVSELEPTVNPYSLAVVFPELHALETLTSKESTECDILKKHPDVRIAISFAENLQASEMKQSSDVEIADSSRSLFLSTHLIDNNRSHVDMKKAPDNGIDPLQLDLSRIVDRIAGAEYVDVDRIADEVKSATTHYSSKFMLQEINNLETLTNKEVIECETAKIHQDVGKAISFDEHHEVSEMNQSLVIADADSHLHMPVHTTDKSSSVLDDQQKVLNTGLDPVHFINALNSLAVVKSPLNDDSLPSMLPEVDICQKPVHKDDTGFTNYKNSADNDEDIIASNDPQIVHVKEGHKEFKVENVDEAELVTYDKIAIATDEKTSGCDGCNLFSKVPNILLDSMSPSNEVNNQDTIGPLENPAFLRTLHYSMGYQPHLFQPITKDELTGAKSNHDLQSHAIFQDPADLDKGWAWVVLFAGFIANVLLGATIYASGVLMLTILEEINPDLTKVSWVGSVFVCAMCFSGPLVEVALQYFGTRLTVFCAGLVFTAGFVGASFATSISELILTHGLIAGIGAGFVVNPVSVSVGQYFFRYRGLACGLLAAGAGAGMLSGGAIISVLLDHYGLSGTYLIWGGVLSHTALLGLLLRPSPEESLRAYERNITATEYYHGFINRSNAVSGLNSLFCSANQSMLSGLDKIGHTKKTIGPHIIGADNSRDPETHLLNTDHCYEDTQAAELETTSHILPCSQRATYLHQKFSQDFVEGDQQHTSLINSLTSMPRTDNLQTVSSPSHDTLINNASDSPPYSSAYILTTSEPAYTNFSPYKVSSLSRSAHGLDKNIHGRLKGHGIFNRINLRDQKFLAHKLTLYSSHSVTPNWSHSRSHGASWRSRFSKSLGLGFRQYTSLSTSPFVTPKANSPPTIKSCSHHALTNNLHHSSSFCNAHIAATSNVTHADDILTSRPSSPGSIRALSTPSRIQRNRTSVASVSQHTALSRNSLPLSYRGSILPSCAAEMDNESITSALISQLRHRDIMAQKYPIGSNSISNFMGSVGSIPTALAIVKDDVVRYETYSLAGISEKGLKGTGIKILDSMRLLTQKPFLIFLFVCFLWAFGESPVMIYLPSYAVSRGTSQIQASMLYTAMGTGSIIGRFLSGLTATDSNIGPAIIYSGCLGIAGLLIVLSPFFTSTFLQQIIFSCLAGIYTGSLVPLSSLIVIEMLELGELGTGFGFISMAQGVGNLIGPPLASLFVTTYGYKNLFVFSGVSLLFGSLLALLMSTYIQESEEMELENQFQKSKLENDLKKYTIAESRHENGLHCEENISKEVTESSRMMKLNETAAENSRDVADCHQHHSKEDKLGTIMEISGK